MEENGYKGRFERKSDAWGKVVQKWNNKAEKRYENHYDECLDEQKEANNCYSTYLFIGWGCNLGEKKF